MDIGKNGNLEEYNWKNRFSENANLEEEEYIFAKPKS